MELGRLMRPDSIRPARPSPANARHLAHLVDDLLDLSAVNSGKIRVDPEETDICEIVEAALISCSLGQGKGVQLRKEFSKAATASYSAPASTATVIWHLGQQRHQIHAARGLALVHIAFRRSGLRNSLPTPARGIASDMLPFVFEPLLARRHVPEQRFSGLGGPGVAKRLVSCMRHGHGTSEGPNRGSTFTTVVLPPRSAARQHA